MFLMEALNLIVNKVMEAGQVEESFRDGNFDATVVCSSQAEVQGSERRLNCSWC